MLSRGPLKKLVSVSGETMESNRNNRQTFTAQNVVAVATHSSKCCCSGNTTAQNVVAVAKLQLKLEPVSFNEIHSYFMILKLYPFDFYTP